MKELELKLAELKKYIGKTDKQDRDKFDALLEDIAQRFNSEEEKEYISNWYKEGLNELKEDVTDLTIKAQLSEITEIVSLSYIAKKYFGKTRSWLYQRISGYPVRGKTYTLNANEKEILNYALQDIAKKISSLSVV